MYDSYLPLQTCNSELMMEISFLKFSWKTSGDKRISGGKVIALVD
jgi:hypothetical protein